MAWGGHGDEGGISRCKRGVRWRREWHEEGLAMSKGERSHLEAERVEVV